MNDEELIKNLKVVTVKCKNEVFKYAGPYLSSLLNNGEIKDFGYAEGDTYYVFVGTQLNDDGTLDFTTYAQEGQKPKVVDLSELLQFIAK